MAMRISVRLALHDVDGTQESKLSTVMDSVILDQDIRDLSAVTGSVAGSVAKAWAVEYDSGERHRYSNEQMQQKFGLTDIRPGMAVEHNLRGRGTVRRENVTPHLHPTLAYTMVLI